MEELAEVARVADLAEKLKAYRTSLAYSYCFLVWSSLMVGLPLIHTAIMFSPWFPAVRAYHVQMLFLVLALGIATSLAIMFYLLVRMGIMGLPTPRTAAIAWPLSFSIPFAVVYGLISALGLFDLMPVAWWLAGGIAYTAVGLSVENALVREKLLFARPFLLMGLLALATSVPGLHLALREDECEYLIGGVLMWRWAAGPLSAMLLAGATHLLAAFLASFYTFLKAERAVFGP